MERGARVCNLNLAWNSGWGGGGVLWQRAEELGPEGLIPGTGGSVHDAGNTACWGQRCCSVSGSLAESFSKREVTSYIGASVEIKVRTVLVPSSLFTLMFSVLLNMFTLASHKVVPG